MVREINRGLRGSMAITLMMGIEERLFAYAQVQAVGFRLFRLQPLAFRLLDCAGLRLQGLGCSVQALGFRLLGSAGFRPQVQAMRFRLLGLGFWVQALGFMVMKTLRCLGFWVQASGFRLLGLGSKVMKTLRCLGFWVQASGFRLQCLGFSLQPLGFWIVQGSGFRVQAVVFRLQALGFSRVQAMSVLKGVLQRQCSIFFLLLLFIYYNVSAQRGFTTSVFKGFEHCL